MYNFLDKTGLSYFWQLIKAKITKEQVGLGNVENKSSANIRSEITKENVTTALGYTPTESVSFTPSLTGGTKVGTLTINGVSVDLYCQTNTNTTTTTGASNTSSKIYLVGATSQSSAPTTYSHDTVYVGTDGHLYSNSKQAVNLSDSQALTNKTYNGYTLGAACEKGVDTTATSGSGNLITSGAMYTALSGKANYEVKSSADFNTMTTPGLYTMKSSSTNAPTNGSYYSLIVNKSDNGDYVQQIAIKESTCDMYIRNLSGSTWSSWKQVALSEAVQTAYDLANTANTKANIKKNPNAIDGDIVDTHLTVGNRNGVYGYKSFTAGESHIASGSCNAVVGGNLNEATGEFYSTIMGGLKNKSTGTSAGVVGGEENTASALNSAVVGGMNNQATQQNSVVVGGNGNTASGNANSLVAGGYSNTASADNSVIVGGGENNATGRNSTVASGTANTAGGPNSFVGGGSNNQASAEYSAIVGGLGNKINNSENHSIILGGQYNTIIGDPDYPAINSGIFAGKNNSIQDECDSSVILGGCNNRIYNMSTARSSAILGGYYAEASDYNTAVGRYNNMPTEGNVSGTYGDVFVVGIGDSTARKNGFRVAYDGNCYAATAMNSTGADYAECFEWADGNPDNEDRIGFMTAFEGDKIRFANENDPVEIIGVVSAIPAVVGDNYADEWCGKYLKDKYGRLLTEHKVHEAEYRDVEAYEEIELTAEEISEMQEEITNDETLTDDEKAVKLSELPTTKTVKVTKQELVHEAYEADEYVLNPDYNADEEYIPRLKRKEYSAVGTHGKLAVRDDGSCEVGGFCRSGNGGIATKSDSGFYVMERIDDETVRIYIK